MEGRRLDYLDPPGILFNYIHRDQGREGGAGTGGYYYKWHMQRCYKRDLWNLDKIGLRRIEGLAIEDIRRIEGL